VALQFLGRDPLVEQIEKLQNHGHDIRRYAVRFHTIDTEATTEDFLHCPVYTEGWYYQWLEMAGDLPSINILFVSADPVDQIGLDIAREHDTLAGAINHSRHANRIILHGAADVTRQSLHTPIGRVCPQVVHFSGLGAPGG